jgi:hypothetical protein
MDKVKLQKSRNYEQLGLLANNHVKIHENSPAVLKGKRGKLILLKIWPLRGHN